MGTFFCPICGIQNAKNNPPQDGSTGDILFNCTECLAVTRFYIQMQPQRTLDEVEQLFQQTELTDSQRGTKKKK